MISRVVTRNYTVHQLRFSMAASNEESPASSSVESIKVQFLIFRLVKLVCDATRTSLKL